MKKCSRVWSRHYKIHSARLTKCQTLHLLNYSKNPEYKRSCLPLGDVSIINNQGCNMQRRKRKQAVRVFTEHLGREILSWYKHLPLEAWRAAQTSRYIYTYTGNPLSRRYERLLSVFSWRTHQIRGCINEIDIWCQKKLYQYYTSRLWVIMHIRNSFALYSCSYLIDILFCFYGLLKNLSIVCSS